MSGGTRSYEMARRLVKWGHQVQMITSFREESYHAQDQGWKKTQAVYAAKVLKVPMVFEVRDL